MLTFDELNRHLTRFNPPTKEVPLTFTLTNPLTGEIRIGALWRTVGDDGWYTEVGNFPDADYLDADDEVPGLFRHFCDADLSEEDPRDTAAARFQSNLECAVRSMFG